MGRATQGVKLINLKNSDSIAAVAKVMHDEDDVENAENVEGLEKAASSEDGTTLDNNINEDNNTDN
jgi:DNA gyrase subunit A